ncbi:MAG: type 4a pilus biogenesis protein PilO [Gammaproteobacteria bacterium]|nr:type 4a pilus biogenesis protein PilO [Gammaproteobacteria bacterium]MDH3411075.1 type 4a pilus biogenesis protein PilO [Gammaproteobacteria bacterium]
MNAIAEKLVAALMRIDRRLVLLMMAVIVALIGFQSWVSLFRQPLAEYRLITSSHKSLKAVERENASLELQIQTLTAQTRALEKHVQNASSRLAQDALLVHLVAELDRLAVQREVKLNSVKPGASREVPMFEEISFDVDARGTYSALFDWLQDIESGLGVLSVKAFNITLATGSGAVNLSLKLAAYRRLTAKEPRP